MKKRIFFYIITFAFILLVIVTIFACKTFYFRTQYQDLNSLLHQRDSILLNSFLKAHLKNGDICIFEDTWTYDSTGKFIYGFGSRYDFNRSKTSQGSISVFIDSVAIFETNRSPKERIAGLTIVAALDVLLGIACITVPKMCFGSCPTFYLDEGNSLTVPDAEGFSSAISPRMEYADIDALGDFYAKQNTASLTMKNEALETHCIKELKLLVFPKNKLENIYHSTEDEFFRCSYILPPSSVFGPEGDITSLLIKPDKNERFSLSDEHDLVTKEEIYLDFIPGKEMTQPALLIHFRQTLMTTFFIYSGLGYMGDQIGDIFASIENGQIPIKKLENGIFKELGDIDVYVYDDQSKKFIFQGKVYEAGPIAINRQIIPISLNRNKSEIKIKLVLTKGLWRIDYAALTNISKKINPIILAPENITSNGVSDKKAMTLLQDSHKHFISMPGQEYNISFKLPASDQMYDLFLFSKGYYLEWMRANWISDKDLIKLNQMIESPAQYLKNQTKEYKKYENQMEKEFWNSKISINSIKHENY